MAPETKTALLSRFSEALIDSAVQALDLTPSQVTQQNFNAFLQREVRARASELNSQSSCKFPNKLYHCIAEAVLRYHVRDPAHLAGIVPIALDQQEAKLKEISIGAMSLLEKVLGLMTPDESTDLSEWSKQVVNLPDFLSSGAFRDQIAPQFGSDLNKTAKVFNTLLFLQSKDLNNLYKNILSCIKTNFSQISGDPLFLVQAMNGCKHQNLLSTVVRDLVIVDLLLGHTLDSYDILHSSLRLQANADQIAERMEKIQVPTVRPSMPISL